MRYRKKPVVVEADLWLRFGDAVREGHQNVQAHPNKGDWICQHCGRPGIAHGWIITLEGGHVVCPGDWIITGVKGERYPCKPDIFEATYEPVEDEQP